MSHLPDTLYILLQRTRFLTKEVCKCLMHFAVLRQNQLHMVLCTMPQHGGVPVTDIQVCITESKYHRWISAVTTTTQPVEQLNYSLRRTKQNWRKNSKVAADRTWQRRMAWKRILTNMHQNKARSAGRWILPMQDQTVKGRKLGADLALLYEIRNVLRRHNR